MSGNKIIKGVAVLGVAGLIVKLLGAVFRIPLQGMIGEEGMAYYGYAYPLYSFFLVVATAGIPVAISRLVSEKIALKNYAGAHKVFRVSSWLLLGIGTFAFCICFFGAELIAKYAIEDMGAVKPLKAIAPALIFVSVMSAFRGYFQGRQNMNPTALSEFAEQVVRVCTGLFLAYYFMYKSLESAAAGATFGATAGSIAGLVIIFLIYLGNKRAIRYNIKRHRRSAVKESSASIIKQILIIAIPITIGSSILPLINAADSMIVPRRLMSSGFSLEEARILWGQLSGYCATMAGLPQAVTQAVAVAMVPAIAAAFKLNDKKEVNESINLGMRASMIIGMPCAIGIMVLAEPILLLLFPKNPAGVANAAPTLMIMCVGVAFMAILQTTTGILQGIDKQMLPVKNLAIGGVVKIVATYIFVGIPFINIKGASMGSIFVYAIAFFLNLRDVKRYTGVKIDNVQVFVKPIIVSALMGVSAFASYRLIYMVAESNTIATLGAIFVGVVVYGFLILATKTITKAEIGKLPKGDKMVKTLDKFIK